MRSSINDYSGKELMEAIYFLSGDAASLIAPINDIRLENMFSEEQIVEIRGHISKLLEGFEKQKPGTFSAFKSKMTSGDHLLIGETITSNAKDLLAYIESNEEVQAYKKAMAKAQKPLATLINTHFPEKNPTITPQEVKEVINSKEFKEDFSNYFDGLEKQLGGKASSDAPDDGATIIIGAAVVIVAAIAVLVIYAVAVLNAVEFANLIDSVWQEEEDGEHSRVAAHSSLLRDQIINSVATNWKAQ